MLKDLKGKPHSLISFWLVIFSFSLPFLMFWFLDWGLGIGDFVFVVDPNHVDSV